MENMDKERVALHEKENFLMRAQQGGGYCSLSSLYRQATDLMQAHACTLCCLSLREGAIAAKNSLHNLSCFSSSHRQQGSSAT